MSPCFSRIIAPLCLAPLTVWGCSEGGIQSTAPMPTEPFLDRGLASSAPAPAPLLEALVGSAAIRLWPFTGTSFDSQAVDPINVVFIGETDPRNVRSALMSVDGDRSGPFAAFDCRWTDAFGTPQTSYSEEGGWSASVVQLECGAFDPFRFHIRLFAAGELTLANAHVEVLIPGTTDHEVLSWALGVQLVTFDLVRSGLLTAAPARTQPINPSPTFGEVRPAVYNQLPPHLRAITGGPLVGTVSTPVGVPSHGWANILTLGLAPLAGGTEQAAVLQFAQVIPKPFCNSGGELIRVDGPIQLRQEVRVSAAGVLVSQATAQGELSVRSVHPLTGELGQAVSARVRDHYHTHIGEGASSVSSSRIQRLQAGGGAPQQLHQQLQVGPMGLTRFRSDERCGG